MGNSHSIRPPQKGIFNLNVFIDILLCDLNFSELRFVQENLEQVFLIQGLLVILQVQSEREVDYSFFLTYEARSRPNVVNQDLLVRLYVNLLPYPQGIQIRSPIPWELVTSLSGVGIDEGHVIGPLSFSLRFLGRIDDYLQQILSAFQSIFNLLRILPEGIFRYQYYFTVQSYFRKSIHTFEYDLVVIHLVGFITYIEFCRVFYFTLGNPSQSFVVVTVKGVFNLFIF